MWSEPPMPEGATKLNVERSGYTSRLTESQETVAMVVSFAALVLWLWGGTNGFVALGWETGTAATFTIFTGFAVPIALMVGIDRWARAQFTPPVIVIGDVVAGDSVTVDIGCAPERVRRVEMLATRTTTGRTHDQKRTKTTTREVDEELARVDVQCSETALQTRFTGTVPARVLFRPTWFIAVHLQTKRGLRYVRPYSVTVQPAGG